MKPSPAEVRHDSPRVLLVGEGDWISTAGTVFEREFGVAPHTEGSDSGGLAVLEDEPVDCLVSDDRGGTQDLLATVRERHPTLPVVVVTEGAPGRVTDLLSAGATDCVRWEGGDEQYEVLANRVLNAARCGRAQSKPGDGEGLFRNLVEESSEPVIVLDADGTRRYVSSAIEDVTGYTPEELVEERGIEIVHPDDRAAFRDAFETVMDEPSGASMEVQYRIQYADGTWHVHESRLTNRLENPVVEGVIVNVRDVTERARLETELDEVFGRVTDAFYALDTEFRFTYVNEYAEELLQRSEEELLGECLWDMYPEAAKEEEVWEAFHTALEEKVQTGYELYFEPLDFWVEANLYPSETGVSVYFRDVTERKEKEAVRNRLLERVSDAFFGLDEDWAFTYLNSRAVELILDADRSAEDVVGTAIWEVFPEAVDTTFEREYRDAMTNQESTTFEEYFPPLETWFEVHAYPSESGLSVFFRDVTERKEREHELERYAAMLETVDDGVYATDADSRFIAVNDAYTEMTGYSRDELLGNPTSMVVGEQLQDEAADRQEALDEDGEFATLEAMLPTADGEEIPIEAHISRFPLDDGYGRVGVVRDITERKEREEAVRASERRFRAVTRSVTDSVVTIDATSTITYANPATEKLFGYSNEEIRGESLTALMPERLRDRHRDGIERYLRTGERNLDWSGLELTGQHKDGNEIPLSVSFGEFEQDGQQFFTGVIRDITEQKRHKTALTTLHDSSQELLHAGDPSDVADIALEAAVEVLGLRGAGVYLYDADDETLGPAAVSEYIQDIFGDLPAFGPGDTAITWKAFAEGTRLTYDDVLETEHVHRTDTPLRSGIWTPLGEHGVLAVLSDEVGAFDERDEQLVDILAATAEAALDRVEHEQVLRRERDLKDRIVETSPTGISIVDADGTISFMNSRAEEILGTSVDELSNRQYDASMWDAIGADGEPVTDEETPFDRMLSTGEPTFDLEFQLRRADGEQIWLTVNGAPIEDADGNVSKVVFAFEDVTDRKRHEEQLAELNELTQEFMEAETPQAVSDVTITGAHEVLGFPVAMLALYDEESGRLERRAHTQPAEEYLDESALFDPNEDRLWEAFVDGDLARFEGDDPLLDGDPVESGIVVPLPRHGLFVAASTEPEGFDSGDLDLARMLASNALSAFDRAERERDLRERDETLHEQNEALQRLNRTNDVIRKIDQALVQATTRAEIEQAVCEHLTSVDPYLFAWIGERDVVGEKLVPRTWAGEGEDYLDSITIETGAEAPQGPAETALREREPAVVGNLLEETEQEPWRKEALQHGFRAVISVPLVYGDSLYGVLNVYAGKPAIFDEMETAVLDELGETVAHAINAVESKKALVSDRVVALELRMDDSDVMAGRFADETGGRFAFRGVIPQQDGPLRVFFTVEDVPPEQTLSFAEDSLSIEHTRLIADQDGVSLFECTVAPSSLIATLIEHGAVPNSVVADDEGVRVEIELPQSADVREFVAMIQSKYSDVGLVSRREYEREYRTKQAFQADIDEALTDRQQEVLRTAFLSGFFEWPRKSTGQEVAELLEISQPTFNRHLRVGEHKVFTLLFDDRQPG